MPHAYLSSWIELNLPVGTWQIAPCRNDSQAVLLQCPLVSAKTQSPKTDDSSSFQKVKEDLVPSDQSKLRPFCGGKWSHHSLARTAGGITHCCLSSRYFTHWFIFPHLHLHFRGSRIVCEYGLTKRKICHNTIFFSFGKSFVLCRHNFQVSNQSEVGSVSCSLHRNQFQIGQRFIHKIENIKVLKKTWLNIVYPWCGEYLFKSDTNWEAVMQNRLHEVKTFCNAKIQ